jgi:arsenate reductase
MPEDFPVVIYHNPDCGTSRNALAMIEAAGYAPVVVEYLKTGWTRDLLLDLAARSGAPLRDLIRDKGALAAELGLLDPGASDEAILEAMTAHPVVVNRPIVATPRGVRLCRPSEQVLDLLERRPDGFVPEDGQIVG